MEIIAEIRTKLGKQNTQLRRDRMIPAVVYGSGLESTSLTIDLNDFIRVYKQTGDTTLIDLKFDNKNEKVLVKEVQLNPVSLNPTHVSFFKVNLKEKIKANVSVEVIGEEESEVIKSGEGLVLVLMNDIEVEALPADLPSSFEIDISGLTEVGQGVTVGEIKFDKEKVELIGVDAEDLVLKIDFAEMQEVEESELSEEELIAGVEATEETAGEDEDITGASESEAN
jgi:large subunit ribosomal protein L25